MPSDFNVIDWLNNFAGNAELDEETVKPILNFVLMWNLFESSACGKRASVQKITSITTYLQEDGAIEREDISEFLDYFVNRYFANGQESDHFPHLNLRREADRQFVESVLSHPSDFQEKEVLRAMLMIVHRYRNNLFHGEKRVYSLHSQVENFLVANRLLAWVLDSLNRVASDGDERRGSIHDSAQKITQYMNARGERTYR